ncbi:MAG: hypothetical protein GY819_13345 [Planctomycetaceae bacterium]|nr:hypothetical protein [Planctomycetaceae bacterium]
MKISGLVIGTRKAGTTWIYQNLLKDGRFRVSKKVKESGFFAGSLRCDYEEYSKLYEEVGQGHPVEVDSSVCYSDVAPDLIEANCPEARIVIILRDPVDYLISRFVHSRRKGELRESSLAESVEQNEWLRDELDYAKILHRFRGYLERGQLLVLPFTLLERAPVQFYDKIVCFISAGEVRADVVPVEDKMNVARSSKFPYLSRLLSDCAKYARARNLHGVVNWAKNTGILKFLEKRVTDDNRDLLEIDASRVIDEKFPTSRDIWQDLIAK